MTPRAQQVAAFYAEHRVEHQRMFYDARRAEYGQAGAQLALLTGVFLAIGAAAAVLAAADVADARTTWGVVAAIAPAIATALAAYDALYGFERNAKLYGDASNALRVAAAERPAATADDQQVASWCAAVEGILRREQAQWGQLTEEADRAAAK